LGKQRNPKAYHVRDPQGRHVPGSYGATPKEAWHNLYLKEKGAGKLDKRPQVEFGKSFESQIKQFFKGYGL